MESSGGLLSWKVVRHDHPAEFVGHDIPVWALPSRRMESSGGLLSGRLFGTIILPSLLPSRRMESSGGLLSWKVVWHDHPAEFVGHDIPVRPPSCNRFLRPLGGAERRWNRPRIL
jgi:hypothetical protein